MIGGVGAGEKEKIHEITGTRTKSHKKREGIFRVTSHLFGVVSWIVCMSLLRGPCKSSVGYAAAFSDCSLCRALFAWATTSAKVSGWCTARSASTFRSFDTGDFQTVHELGVVQSVESAASIRTIQTAKVALLQLPASGQSSARADDSFADRYSFDLVPRYPLASFNISLPFKTLISTFCSRYVHFFDLRQIVVTLMSLI